MLTLYSKSTTMKESIFISDPVYGEREVKSPVLIELIDSQPLQRLKRINQFGIPDEFYHKENFSRFDHCTGVMFLLEHLGASEEEQAAGLLHDVSHMAFSHLYDWVVDDYTKPGGTESRQDDIHVDFIRNSEIPDILQTHGYNVDHLTNYHHFGLLERDSPDLCADRVDYSLREFPSDTAKKIYQGLTTYDDQIVCNNLETAQVFGREFLNLQMDHWGGYEALVRYHLFSGVLKRALEQEIIGLPDFSIDDGHIVDKLKHSSDSQIQKMLQFLRQKHLTQPNEGVRVFKKFRFIDPPFLTDEGLKRLSEHDDEYKQALNQAREKNNQGLLVPNLI